ncbi:MAG: RNA 2',3'-cyclic phosphodiesterase [Phycisphaerae bacterium]|nr:RNA 2',3'-cyclic phosphodiesterase [Phycisphaerae bacterium]
MRCFVAIELSDGIQQRLSGLQQRQSSLDRAIRWALPEQIHLTLKFLGEVPDATVPALCATMADVASQHAPLTLAVRGAGCFPPSGAPRIFWAGIEESSGMLARLRDACEAAFETHGFAREKRKFMPHLTIGRVKDPRAAAKVRAAAGAEADFDAGEQAVREIILFESTLLPQGARYSAVARATLGPGQ